MISFLNVQTNQNFYDKKEHLSIKKKDKNQNLNVIYTDSEKSNNDVSEIIEKLPCKRLTLGEILDKDKKEFDILDFNIVKKTYTYEDRKKIVFDITNAGKEEYYLQSGLFAGYIQNGELTINIKISYGETFLNRMLDSVSQIFSAKSLSELDKRNRNSDFPLIEYLFLASLQKISMLGFPKKYKTYYYHEQKMLGTFDFKSYIRKDIPFKGKISSKKNELSNVQSIIDVLYKASCMCRKEMKAYFPNLAVVLSDLKNQYSGQVLNSVILNNAINSRTLNTSMYSEVKRSLRFAELLLKKNNMYPAACISLKDRISGFLVDVSSLWENYLVSLLRKNIHGWMIYAQKELNLYEGTFFARKNYPDIVMERENSIVILDAKFKHMSLRNEDVDRDDLFQIQSYAGYYLEKGQNVALCGLLYPLEKSLDVNYENSCSKLYGLENSNTKFIIDGIYVPDGIKYDELKKNEEKFISRIKEYLI